jgi:2-hydroxyacyl-CoA lyase 1
MKPKTVTERLASLTPDQQALLHQQLSENTISGHELIALSLEKLGITHIYTISGVPIQGTLAACLKIGIRIIGVHHQQAAVMMALAQNYVAGRMLAITICSAGPSILNAITGISIAKDNCWPVLVIGGATPLNMKGMGCFQELNAVPIIQPITKWAALISAAKDIPYALKKAVETATSERYGPVYLEIPEDILIAKTQRACVDSASKSNKPGTSLPLNSIQSAAEYLLSARQPLIIIGNSIRWSDAQDELKHLVESFSIPFISSPMSQGYLPDNHLFCFNTDRSYVQNNADVVIIIGARLDWTFRYGSELSKEAATIQFDAAKNELDKNISSVVSVAGDIKQILINLLAHMEHTCSISLREDTLHAWFSCLNNRRLEKSVKLQQASIDSSLPMSPVRLMKEIRDFFPKDSIYILDGNVCMAAAQRIIPSYFPASRLTAGKNGCMGVGIPFAIGAKLSQANRPVIVISGDFAFGLNGMEMETALRYNIPIIVIIANNSGATGALSQKKFYPQHHESVTLFNKDIRYDDMVKAFDGHGEFVNTPEDLIPAFKHSMASGKASLINVIVDPDAHLYSRL